MGTSPLSLCFLCTVSSSYYLFLFLSIPSSSSAFSSSYHKTLTLSLNPCQDESLLAQFGDVKEIWLESGSNPDLTLLPTWQPVMVTRHKSDSSTLNLTLTD